MWLILSVIPQTRVWLSNDRASQSAMMQYAQEYLDHGIKVWNF